MLKQQFYQLSIINYILKDLTRDSWSNITHKALAPGDGKIRKNSLSFQRLLIKQEKKGEGGRGLIGEYLPSKN